MTRCMLRPRLKGSELVAYQGSDLSVSRPCNHGQRSAHSGRWSVTHRCLLRSRWLVDILLHPAFRRRVALLELRHDGRLQKKWKRFATMRHEKPPLTEASIPHHTLRHAPLALSPLNPPRHGLLLCSPCLHAWKCWRSNTITKVSMLTLLLIDVRSMSCS